MKIQLLAINFLLMVSLLFATVLLSQTTDKIDRKALVSRHNIKMTKVDSLSSLSVGNGGFACTVDVTGLQTFPNYYAHGVPLGTQSEWGWHSFPNKNNYKLEETFKEYDLNGRKISYATQQKGPERIKDATDYFRQNPHRLQLGNIGFEIIKKDGSIATIDDIKNIHQTLDLWAGEIKSHFTIEGQDVDVATVCHQQEDVIGVQVNSNLIKENRLKILVRFPFPTNGFADDAVYYGKEDAHQSAIINSNKFGVVLKHQLDTATYFVGINWQNQQASIKEKGKHQFIVSPNRNNKYFSASFYFSQLKTNNVLLFKAIENNSTINWEKFWQSGGAVNLAGSTDSRANELERRIILSQYLTKIQCNGHYPPQETGLTFNSWYGRPHLEMHWWHAVHFALWGRTDMMEKSLDWYFKAKPIAASIAKRQGFDGVRWQKMTDNLGSETPSSVGTFLIWQQPHFIYMAELAYKNNTDKKVLNKYKDLLFATADFMASFSTWNKEKNQFDLGPGLIPAQECYNPVTTFNPTYELCYWYWALETAQKWRLRLGMKRNKVWDNVLQHLAPLPTNNRVYFSTESTEDCYTDKSKYLTDHPAVLMAYNSFPAVHGLDKNIMKNTLDTVLKKWDWPSTWGWDYPMVAMAATRLLEPEKAMDALMMNVQKNTYLLNGHNYQDKRLTIYLPGNGGLLSAVAMMCAGFEGGAEMNPGFPKNGKWQVRWEGLNKIF